MIQSDVLVEPEEAECQGAPVSGKEVAVEESSDWDPDLETVSESDPVLETVSVEPLSFGLEELSLATGMLLVLVVRVTAPLEY